MKRVLTEKRFLILGICVGIAFWFIEAFFHAFFFKHGPLKHEILPLSDPHELWMRALIVILFTLFGVYTQFVTDKRKAMEREREKLLLELQKSLEEIKTLRNILPICASCKKVRDDKGYWHQLESYLSEHSQTDFSHGICPDCMKKLYSEYKEKNTEGTR